jgi:hypothetical protein
MKKFCIIKRYLSVVFASVIGSTVTVHADPPVNGFKYAVIKPKTGSWDSIAKLGCERAGLVSAADSQEFSFVSCKTEFSAGRVAEGSGWFVQPVDQYQRLGASGSLKIAIDAFVDPAAVRSTEVRWFYPAIGNTPAEQASWAIAIGKKLDTFGVGSSLTTQRPGGVYSAFDYAPAYANLEVQSLDAMFGIASSDASTLGISLSVEESKKLQSLSNFGLKNGAKIVSFNRKVSEF